MDKLASTASTSGEVALFFLIAGISPRDYSAVECFAVNQRNATGTQEVIGFLNGIPKPALCIARAEGSTLRIVTQVVSDPNALRARTRFLQLTCSEPTGRSGTPGEKHGMVLVQSEHGTMMVAANVLQQFYEQYDVPHTSSQSSREREGAERFRVVIRVHAAGWVELRASEDELTQEG